MKKGSTGGQEGTDPPPPAKVGPLRKGGGDYVGIDLCFAHWPSSVKIIVPSELLFIS